MNASKTLIAAIAAATIVGTVGFVSAQTTDTNGAGRAVHRTDDKAPRPRRKTCSRRQPTRRPTCPRPRYVAPQSDSSTAP